MKNHKQTHFLSLMKDISTLKNTMLHEHLLATNNPKNYDLEFGPAKRANFATIC